MEPPSQPTPVLRRVMVSLVLVVVLVGAGAAVRAKLVGMRRNPGRENRTARAIAVRVRPVERRVYQEKLIGYGRARALRATAVAAEVAGIVRWLAPDLEAGAAVQEGAELVKLDDRDLKETLRAAQARLRKTEAEAKGLDTELKTNANRLALALEERDASQREVDRIAGLEGRGGATKSELDRERLRFLVRRAAVVELEGRHASLEAQLERNRAEGQEIEAQVAEATLNLGRTVVHAPYAGRVEARRVELGARVAPGTVLFELVDLARVEIPVALPASRYGQIPVGAPASVRLGEAQQWQGSVARIAPGVSPADRTFFAYLVVENTTAAAPVPPGAFVTAEVQGRRFEAVLVLPRTAFVGTQVFVHRDGVARVRTPSVRYALPHVLIADGGLEEGDEIILTNLEEIADGTRIVPIREEPPGDDS
ncbi:MAG: efflux RND transporter periplasmic adaptor subunit [Planctomycetota bacterium]|jgi:RND family efflux transporter MFP subunit